jgi:hypothetical protein
MFLRGMALGDIYGRYRLFENVSEKTVIHNFRKTVAILSDAGLMSNFDVGS